MNNKKTIFLNMKNIKEHNASLILIILLCIDLVFILLHFLNSATPFLNHYKFSLCKDMGYPEIYQYLKWFCIMILLVYISVSRKSYSYVIWVLVFTYFLFDDALKIHERAASYMVRHLNLTPVFGLKPHPFGELSFSLVVGILFLFLVLWAYIHGSQAFKKISQDMLILIFALFFFGVVVDVIHTINFGKYIYFVLGVLEDGGEMLVASLILWYVFLLSLYNENNTPHLYNLIHVILTRHSNFKVKAINENKE